MSIKVSSVEEEYRWLRANPHRCPDGREGEWEFKSQALTFEAHDELSVKCKTCGHETVFDFDISSKFPQELLDALKEMGKQ